jgi:hypothetical protein
VKRELVKLAALAAIFFLIVFGGPRATIADSIYRYHKGLHLSRERPLTNKELGLLVNGLRTLTGFLTIEITSNRDLTVADRAQISGGSALARDLFTAALDGDESFTIENWAHSSRIAFAQLDSVLRYSNGGRSYEDWRIRIDFADFRELRGDKAALASFDPGMAFMHELTHAILRYPDPLDLNDQLGDCERYVNRIRAELRLPLREHYYPKNRVAISPGSLTGTPQGTIAFAINDEPARKQKSFSVTFALDQVVDFSKAKPRHVVQSAQLPSWRARR